MDNEQQHKTTGNWACISSLCFGIASIFLWEFSIVPILAIIFGVIGLVRDEKKWKAGIGITLGVVYLIVRIAHGPVTGIFSNPFSGNNTPQISVVTTPEQAPAYTMTKLELYEKACDTLPKVPSIQGLAPTATIDENSLIVRSEPPAIYGTFTNAGGLVVVIWQGRLSLSPILSDALREHQSIYSDSGDHGGGLWSCPVGSASGRYGNKIWRPLPVGEYTVGVYAGSYPIYNPGFNGDYTPAKLLATGILKVVPK